MTIDQSPPDREADIMNTLARLADTLVESYDVIELLTDLADSCVRILDVDAAGVSLAEDDDLVKFVAPSDESMEAVELFEIEQREGPCLDAYRQGRYVGTDDIEADRERWPEWAPVALGRGYSAAAAVPMRLRTTVIGALNVYSTRQRQLNDRDIATATALAGMATIGIIHQEITDRHRVVKDQLQGALNSRVLIEQAKGTLAERLGVPVEEAFRHLRRHARNHNLHLTDVARSVVEGELVLPSDSDSPNSDPESA